jgi:hypothetical protein
LAGRRKASKKAVKIDIYSNHFNPESAEALDLEEACERKGVQLIWG